MASGPSFDMERVAHYEGKTTAAGRSICCYSCCIHSAAATAAVSAQRLKGGC